MILICVFHDCMTPFVTFGTLSEDVGLATLIDKSRFVPTEAAIATARSICPFVPPPHGPQLSVVLEYDEMMFMRLTHSRRTPAFVSATSFPARATFHLKASDSDWNVFAFDP